MARTKQTGQKTPRRPPKAMKADLLTSGSTPNSRKRGNTSSPGCSAAKRARTLVAKAREYSTSRMQNGMRHLDDDQTAGSETTSIEDILTRNIPEPELTEVKRMLYGKPVRNIELSDLGSRIATEKGFEMAGYAFDAAKESLRTERKVRLGLIQNAIVLPTTAPIADQRAALWARVADMVEAAAANGANIVCFQEAWIMVKALTSAWNMRQAQNQSMSNEK